MTKPKSDPCKVTSTTGRAGNISAHRLKLEKIVEASQTPMTTRQMADAAGISHQNAANVMRGMTMAGKWVNVGRKDREVLYLHVNHLPTTRSRTATQVPVVNANQPNGNAAWWRANAPWLQAPARECSA